MKFMKRETVEACEATRKVIEVGWWEEARSGAAREFGARHYRLFAAVAVGRKLLPVLAGVATVVGVVAAAAWSAGRWEGWWAAATQWAPTLAWWAAGVGALAALIAGGIWLWRWLSWP